MPINVTATLRRAMQSLRSERQRLDHQIRAVQVALGITTNSQTGSNSHGPVSRRPRMSPEARRALSKRMKAYWAAKRREKTATKPKKS